MSGLPSIDGPIPVLNPDRPQRVERAEGPGFADMLQGAIEKVDRAQVEGDHQVAKLASGEGNLHETAIAMEKADISMRVAVKIRNKLVEAYSEIMRMPL